MIYTQDLRDALVDAFQREAEYSGWESDYVARNLANYDAVPLGTVLDSDRDFEDMIASGDLDEDDLNPVENVILSSGYFGLDHLAGR